MKKRFLLILLIFAISTLFLTKETFSGVGASGVSGTPHDLSVSGSLPWRGMFDTDEVCVFCHTPHLGQQQAIYPLWNKNLSTATFSMYTSPTFDMGPSTTIGSPSTLCMSCHDGNMAMNVAVNSPGSGTTGSIPLINSGDKTKLSELYGSGFTEFPGPNITNNLADDHPISFTYDPNDDPGNGFPAPTAGGKIPGATSGANYPLYTNSNGSNQFECSTCHDVHDTAMYDTKDLSEVFFLRTSNAESFMCRDCHVAKY